MKLKISLLSLILGAAVPLFAQQPAPADSVVAGQQDVIVIDPLFEYPVAPEELPDLESKTNYLMENFWKPFDFKSKRAVDQTALNDAFATYTSFMNHADRQVVNKSVDELVKKLKKNPTLLYQFTRTAEENLYGPRANVWIDEVYLKFLDAIADNKKIDSSRKARYLDQRRRILASPHGGVLAPFSFTAPDGSKKDYVPAAKVNIIEFGDPGCDNCRKSKILLEVNFELRDLIEKGDVSMTFVNLEDSDLPASELFSSYPESWTVGSNTDIVEQIDIRDYPSFYVLDSKGTILGKNLNVQQAIMLTLAKIAE